MMRLQTNRLKNGQYGHVQFETPKGVEEAVKLAGACAPSSLQNRAFFIGLPITSHAISL